MSVNSGRYDAERVVSDALAPLQYDCDCYGCPGSSSAAETAVQALLNQPSILRDLLAITMEGTGVRA